MAVTKDFSKSDLISALETIEASFKCKSNTEIQQLTLQAKELLCADYSVCGLGEFGPNGQTEMLHFVNGNYPAEWVDIYLKENLKDKDPIMRHQMQFMMTQLWSDTFKLYTDKSSRQFLSNAQDFNLKYGLSSGIYDPEMNIFSVFSFAGANNRFTKHQKQIADLLIPHLHRAVQQQYTGLRHGVPSNCLKF